jgi:hypothetical protein
MKYIITIVCLVSVFVFYLFIDISPNKNKDSPSKQKIILPLSSELPLSKTITPILMDSLSPKQIDNAIEPVRPTKLEAYNKHLKRAEAGIIEDKYLVSSILNSCSLYMTLEEIDIIRREESQFHLDGTLSLELEDIHHKCYELNESLNGLSIKNLHESWRESAASQGYALAKIEIEMEKGNMKREKLLKLLQVSFKQSNGNEYLMDRLTYHMRYFYTEFMDNSNEVEKTVDHNSIAWEHLSCIPNVNCSQIEFELLLESNFDKNQINEILKTSEHYKKAIRNEDWESLGLH